MSRRRSADDEPIAGDEVVQPNAVRIVRSIEADIEVAGDEDRLAECGDNVEDCRQLSEERRLYGL